jgi:hypothetical protein
VSFQERTATVFAHPSVKPEALENFEMAGRTMHVKATVVQQQLPG